MKLGLIRVAQVVAFAIAAVACSSTSDSASPAATPSPEAGPPVDDDAGITPAPVAPARLAAPTIVSAGGTILKAPKILVATFGEEPFAADLETFAKTIGASAYWHDVTSEYGVGPATFARSVKIAEAPVTITQSAIETWLVGQLDGTHPEWGTPDASTIYTIAYPKGTTVSIHGTPACESSPAWHGEIQVAGGTRVPYAVITRCDPFIGLDGIHFVTAGLSHEWLEAATNPFYRTSPAFNAPTKEDAHWGAVNFGELGDMCATTPTVYFEPEGFPFTVQRSWSNASAAAGHDPCVPRAKEPYFIATTTTDEKVAIGGVVDADWVRGIVIPVGESRTIDIALYSDGQTSGPWTVKARDYASRMGDKPDLSFAFDRAKGTGGETLHLTITRIKKDENLGDAAIFELVSTLGPHQSVWIAAVGDKAR